jgi:hypothetical protein
MSNDPITRFLRARGVAEHLVDGGLEGLVSAWEQTAAAIEEGYGLTLDDYLNDLDVREILGDALATMPEPDGPLLDRLRAADDRVRAATVVGVRCLWGDENRATHGWTARENWWYFAIPAAPGEELAEDLTRNGFGPKDSLR